MKVPILTVIILVAFANRSVDAAEEKGILEILPGLDELGQGWTTNLVTYLVDPRSEPSEIAFGEDPRTSPFLKWLRTSLSGDSNDGCLAKRTAYCLAHYGMGDLVFNRGEYQLCIMRWGEKRSLGNCWVDWKMSRLRVVREAPFVGEDFYWTEDLTAQKLTFRRGLFTVVVTAGLRSDRQPIIRLAQAIDAKIRGRPVPGAEPVEQRGKPRVP